MDKSVNDQPVILVTDAAGFICRKQTFEMVIGWSVYLNRRAMQPGDVPVTYADISHARRILGYHPQMSFRKGIEAFVNWYGTEHLIHLSLRIRPA